MFLVLLFTLFFVGIVVWLAIYAACEAWSLWAQHKYRIRFRLDTFLVILSAACATAGVINLMRDGMQLFDGAILAAIIYVLMLGAAFFADMLIRDCYQAVSGRRGSGMEAYRDTSDGELELDEQGQPIVPDDGRPKRGRERKRPKITELSVRNSYGAWPR